MTPPPAGDFGALDVRNSLWLAPLHLLLHVDRAPVAGLGVFGPCGVAQAVPTRIARGKMQAVRTTEHRGYCRVMVIDRGRDVLREGDDEELRDDTSAGTVNLTRWSTPPGRAAASVVRRVGSRLGDRGALVLILVVCAVIALVLAFVASRIYDAITESDAVARYCCGRDRLRCRTERPSKPVYEAELERLQAELVTMQQRVIESGARILVMFEGRDAAGSGRPAAWSRWHTFIANLAPELAPDTANLLASQPMLAPDPRQPPWAVHLGPQFAKGSDRSFGLRASKIFARNARNSPPAR
jgi:hypothetical protein